MRLSVRNFVSGLLEVNSLGKCPKCGKPLVGLGKNALGQNLVVCSSSRCNYHDSKAWQAQPAWKVVKSIKPKPGKEEPLLPRSDFVKKYDLPVKPKPGSDSWRKFKVKVSQTGPNKLDQLKLQKMAWGFLSVLQQSSRGKLDTNHGYVRSPDFSTQTTQDVPFYDPRGKEFVPVGGYLIYASYPNKSQTLQVIFDLKKGRFSYRLNRKIDSEEQEKGFASKGKSGDLLKKMNTIQKWKNEIHKTFFLNDQLVSNVQVIKNRGVGKGWDRLDRLSKGKGYRPPEAKDTTWRPGGDPDIDLPDLIIKGVAAPIRGNKNIDINNIGTNKKRPRFTDTHKALKQYIAKFPQGLVAMKRKMIDALPKVMGPDGKMIDPNRAQLRAELDNAIRTGRQSDLDKLTYDIAMELHRERIAAYTAGFLTKSQYGDLERQLVDLDRAEDSLKLGYDIDLDVDATTISLRELEAAPATWMPTDDYNSEIPFKTRRIGVVPLNRYRILVDLAKREKHNLKRKELTAALKTGGLPRKRNTSKYGNDSVPSQSESNIPAEKFPLYGQKLLRLWDRFISI
jgi:hypothetical protein